MQTRITRLPFAKFIASGLLLVISTSLSLLLCEALLRRLHPAYNPTGMIKFRRIADGTPLLQERESFLRQWKDSGDYDVWVHSDSLGFRNGKDLTAVPEETWYVVGDSFSFGHGVEEFERYSDLLESYYGAGEVVNISIPTDFDGYDKLLSYAKRNGATIRHLIVGVCMENDLRVYESSRTDQSRGKADRSGRAALSEALLLTKATLTETSALYNLFTRVVHERPAWRRALARLGLIGDPGPEAGDVSDEAIVSSVERLLRLRKEHHVDPIVLIIPSRLLWTGTGAAAARATHDKFTGLLRANGFTVVDVRAEFEASGDPLRYHFPHDGHWNPRGHEVAAELLLQHIGV